MMHMMMHLLASAYRHAVDKSGVIRRQSDLRFAPNAAPLLGHKHLQTAEQQNTPPLRIICTNTKWISGPKKINHDFQPTFSRTWLYWTALLKTDVLVPRSPTPRVSSIILLLLLTTPSVSWAVFRAWMAAPKLSVIPYRNETGHFLVNKPKRTS